MPAQIEKRLAELKIELPNPVLPVANYVPSIRSGDLLFISGQVSQWNGESRFIGKLGADISIEQGKEAAKLCALNILAQAKHALQGDLDRIVQIVRLCGYVNASPDFINQPQVINGASDLMVEIFGEIGRHSRSAIGVNSLPRGVSVEIDAVFNVR